MTREFGRCFELSVVELPLLYRMEERAGERRSVAGSQ
jgi:hypothetical protein